MLTAGVYVLVGLAIGGATFLLISKWRGMGPAFLAVCWVPLVALAVAYTARERLGYSALAILMVATLASLGLSALGVSLGARARRARSPQANRLAAGAAVAGIPALIVIAAALLSRAR